MIMAGGSGTRLWPMSTTRMPKQLIPLVDGRSLLQEAERRLEGLFKPKQRLVCTGEVYRAAILQTMPEIGDEQVLGEPVGRDTLAAVGLPAAVIAGRDPEAVIAVFTADHIIEPVEAFQRAVRVGLQIVEKRPETLVTFGIEPTYAATGYGYVRLGAPLSGFDSASVTAEFKEKPDGVTAERYVASGEYRWNSGMFVWRAATLLDCIRRFKPGVYAGLKEVAQAWDTSRRADVLRRVYPTLEKVSVDYAIMERAVSDPELKVATVSMPVKWMDIGGWVAYGGTLEADAAGNRVGGTACVQLDSRENIVVGDDPNHLIATIGVEDLIVVRTQRATLICRRDQAERIKELHDRIGKSHGEKFL